MLQYDDPNATSCWSDGIGPPDFFVRLLMMNLHNEFNLCACGRQARTIRGATEPAGHAHAQ